MSNEIRLRKQVERQKVAVQRELDRAILAEITAGIQLRLLIGLARDCRDYDYAEFQARREALGANKQIEAARLLFDTTFNAINADSPENAVPLIQECLAAAKVDPKEDQTLSARQSAVAYRLVLKGLYSEAEIVARAALANAEKSDADGMRVSLTKARLGLCLVKLQRFEEAEELLLRGFEGMRKTEGPVPNPHVTEALSWIVELYENCGRRDLATEWRSKLAERGPSSTLAMFEMPSDFEWALAFHRAGQHDRSATFFRRLLASRLRYFPKQHPQVIDAANSLGWQLSQAGETEEAERHLLESYSAGKSANGFPHSWLRTYCERLVEHYERSDRAEEAAKWRRELEVLMKQIAPRSAESSDAKAADLKP